MQCCVTPDASTLLKAVSLLRIGVFCWKGTLNTFTKEVDFRVPFQPKTPI